MTPFDMCWPHFNCTMIQGRPSIKAVTALRYNSEPRRDITLIISLCKRIELIKKLFDPFTMDKELHEHMPNWYWNGAFLEMGGPMYVSPWIIHIYLLASLVTPGYHKNTQWMKQWRHAKHGGNVQVPSGADKKVNAINSWWAGHVSYSYQQP